MVFNQFCLFDSFPVSIEAFPAGGVSGGGMLDQMEIKLTSALV